MFSGFDSNKKREKSRKDPAIGIAGRDNTAVTGSGAAASGQDPRELGGVTIQEFSKIQKIAEPEAWRMLRRGEIVGRTHEGRLYVFTNAQDVAPVNVQHDQLSDTINELIADEPEYETETLAVENPAEESMSSHPKAQETVSQDLPPLPGGAPHISGAEYPATEYPASAHSGSRYLPVASERIGSTEIALLLDHLSLAKEENREILKMTQESIRKVTELTDTIVEMKDSLLDARETQILFLKDQLDGREKEIRKLKQQKEDLEILAQTIISTQQPEKPRR